MENKSMEYTEPIAIRINDVYNDAIVLPLLKNAVEYKEIDIINYFIDNKIINNADSEIIKGCFDYKRLETEPENFSVRIAQIYLMLDAAISKIKENVSNKDSKNKIEVNNKIELLLKSILLKNYTITEEIRTEIFDKIKIEPEFKDQIGTAKLEKSRIYVPYVKGKNVTAAHFLFDFMMTNYDNSGWKEVSKTINVGKGKTIKREEIKLEKGQNDFIKKILKNIYESKEKKYVTMLTNFDKVRSLRNKIIHNKLEEALLTESNLKEICKIKQYYNIITDFLNTTQITNDYYDEFNNTINHVNQYLNEKKYKLK